MIKFLKFLIAFLLLPSIAWAVAEGVRIFGPVLGHYQIAWPFFVGMVLYPVLHYTVYDFSRPYVFIHEMTHALCAWMCGYKVTKISVKKNDGYVKMNKTNTFVVLAPYFIPGYLLITALLYVIASGATDVTVFRPYVLGLIGFFLSFHFVQTFHTLWEADQPDLELAGGKMFSLVSIVLANLFILAIVLKVLYPQEVHLRAALVNVAKGTLTTWRIIVDYIVEWFINTL